MSQSASFTPFRTPIPAISHLEIFGFKRENSEDVQCVYNFNNGVFVLNKESSIVSICCMQRLVIKNVNTFYIWVILAIIKKNSKTSIKRYAEIGSPCLVPLSKLKYLVVVPPFIIHDS